MKVSNINGCTINECSRAIWLPTETDTRCSDRGNLNCCPTGRSWIIIQININSKRINVVAVDDNVIPKTCK